MMGTKRDEFIEKVWGGLEPFAERAAFQDRVDFQGWGSQNPILNRAVQDVKPICIAEIGVWKGGSTITMAKEIRRLGLDAVVVSIDTWLGAADHWWQPAWFKDLRFEAGYPTLFKTFCANIIASNLEDLVVPLPLDSLNAATVFRHYNIRPDVVHIDGGHDYSSVLSDLKAWWPLLNEGGALIGDDYYPGGEGWPEVKAAFQEFFQTKDIEHLHGKCFIRKKSVSAN